MASEEKHTSISATNLSIGYFRRKKVTPIAEDLSFSFTQGTLIGLVGENGIGKSTLLRTLAGVQPSLKGKVLLSEQEISTLSPLAMAKQLSVVLTESPASKNLTVIELISLGRQPHTNWMGSLTTHDTIVIQEAMRNTETQELAHRKCLELSDGQLQRVAIARALAQDTPVIILDEPTTHLDLYHRAYILKLLKKLTLETGKTILFSTHEIDLAIQLCDKLMVMTPNELFCDTPKNLIDAKRFDVLFPKDTIRFDKNSGRFSVIS